MSTIAAPALAFILLTLLLQLFKKQPASVEFVYLRNAAPDSVRFNPYNLDVVPHAEVQVCANHLRGLPVIHVGAGVAL